MKFKVGDKVKIKNNLKEIDGFCGGYIKDLQNYVGQIYTIENVQGNGKAVHLEKNSWTWDIRALELVESKQFTKNDLQDGDIVTYRDGKKRTKQKDKFRNDFDFSVISEYREDLTRKDNYTELDIIKVERPIQYETVFERKEEILDKAEKRYLSNVIRPFRKDIKCIAKNVSCIKSKEFIHIILTNDRLFLPYFEKDTMYKNMEVDRKYALEELGL